MTTASVRNEGADIIYDRDDKGPRLLMISGPGGDRYAAIAEILADRYAVVRYDRRCNARSTGDRSVDMDVAQQARDAAAVVRATGYERALVFGNSGGAMIGSQLAAHHPDYSLRTA